MYKKFNGMKFNRNQTINWKRIWEKFDNLVGDPTLANMKLFKEWSGKYGQLALLRMLLAEYIIADDTEWKRFNRRFQNWFNNAYNKPISADWKNQQEWIEDYFKALDVS